jgi:hypothetical protein
MDVTETVGNALRWIIGILDRHNIQYQITGGFAAKLYGSSREVNDIDIDIFNAHPVVPGSPICGMRMPCGGRLRRAQEGIEWLASNRCVDSPARAKGPRNCHRHADKQLKAPEKLNLIPASDFTRQP